MNKKVVIISIIICLAYLTPIFIGETSPQTNLYVSATQSAGWYDATHCYTIDDALTNMTTGDTVYIWNGSYNAPTKRFLSGTYIGNGTDSIINTSATRFDNSVTFSYVNFSSSTHYCFEFEDGNHTLNLNNCSFNKVVYIEGGYNHNIENNYFYGDGELEITSINNSHIHDNRLRNLDTWFSHDIIIENNSMNPVSFEYGFFGDNIGNNFTIVNNTFNCEYAYIEAYGDNAPSYNLYIYGNNFSGSTEYGVYLYDFTNGLFYDNNISIESGEVFWFDDNTIRNFTIYNNYFNFSNGTFAHNEPVANISFNTTKTLGTNIMGGLYIGGNWWWNYTGCDTDGDGLGNTPYTIDGYTDYLPVTNNESIIHYHLYVDDDADPSWYNETNVHNISEAITNGSDGSEIYIYNGNYTESSLIFSKNQSFRGQNEWEVKVYTGSEVLILDTILLYNMTIASNFGERILYISSDNTRLDSIYVFGSIHNDELLRIAQTLHVTINNSIFYSNLTSNEGIMIIGGSGTSPATRHLNITNNQIINPTSGIEVWGCLKYMNVLNNTIYNNSNGIYTEWDEDDGLLYTTISYNHIYDCSNYGMYLHDNVGPLYIKHNNIHNNANGISMTGYYEKEVSCDTFSNYIYNITNLGLKSRKFNNHQCYNNTLWNVSDGMNFTFSDNVTLSYNYVNASQTGYYLNFTNSEFLNNTAISCDVGVDFYCNTTLFHNNSFYYNRIGIRGSD